MMILVTAFINATFKGNFGNELKQFIAFTFKKSHL